MLNAHQRAGAGRLLIAALARRLIAEGDQAMALWVLRGNIPARRFYAALGGREIASHHLPDLAAEEVAYGWTDIRPLARGTG